ncbi:hypothetical protein HELRODRAFT_179214 [Helobdella robusta]|uniref:Uncharacterized protein n=1 Tax=Helobdella robusta TaxID=6412 RepID=T1FED1_HELRO|nr:hypothetical protein HELRODRAFT_179214 [Helobdella robusta]ESN95446.1 hypothetical protein HELRODRAFT_179214 [Helobdella robusta]
MTIATTATASAATTAAASNAFFVAGGVKLGDSGDDNNDSSSETALSHTFKSPLLRQMLGSKLKAGKVASTVATTTTTTTTTATSAVASTTATTTFVAATSQDHVAATSDNVVEAASESLGMVGVKSENPEMSMKASVEKENDVTTPTNVVVDEVTAKIGMLSSAEPQSTEDYEDKMSPIADAVEPDKIDMEGVVATTASSSLPQIPQHQQHGFLDVERDDSAQQNVDNVVGVGVRHNVTEEIVGETNHMLKIFRAYQFSIVQYQFLKVS